MSDNATPTPPGAEEAAQDRFRRTEAVFRQARRMEAGAERRAFVHARCAGDAHLERDVLAWLDGHDEAERTSPGTAPAHRTVAEAAWEDARAESERTPERVGRYRIRGLIGTGGMGTVYEAEQDDPARIVALKLLHPELDDAALRARFRTEADILARLHHDGIASVFDVGEVDTQLGSRLYIAMERVHGRPLRVYLDQERPDREARLALLLAICEAVRHAHRNGVIHRDLKPSNIIVRDGGAPKLLDFGVARRVDRESDLTRTGHVVGTYRYMSPEQADVDHGRVDSRADVYALGVIGYEMLADRHPLEDVTPPSGSVPRDVPSLGAVDRSLRGDLSIIFAKALEADPDDRYPDVAPFAEDLHRFLGAEPILARPRSRAYHFRKFVSRNRVWVGAAAVAITALIVGFVLALGSAKREERYREEADRTAALADQAAYIATIKAAASDIADARPAAARTSLADLSAERRGWEWYYLWTQLDTAAQVIRWPRMRLKTDERLFVEVERTADGVLRLIGVTEQPTEQGKERWAGRARGWPALAQDGLDFEVPRTLSVGSPPVHWQRLAHGVVLRGAGHPDGGTRFMPGTDVHDVVPSPDQRVVAIAGRDQAIRLLDARQGTQHGVLHGHGSAVLRLAFDSRGARLVSGGVSGVVLVWDPKRRALDRALLGHRQRIRQLAVLDDDSGIVTMDSDSLRLWDLAAEDALGVMRRPAAPEGRFIYDLDVSPTGARLASASYDGHLEICCTRTGKRLLRARFPLWPTHPRSYCTRFSPDGRWVAVSEGRLSVFDTITGRLAWTSPKDLMIREFAFDAGSDRIVAISRVGIEGIVSIALADGKIEPVSPPEPISASSSLALSPDGERVAYTSGRHIHVRSLKSGALLWSREGPRGSVMESRWSPDGRALATAWDDGTVRLWGRDSGTPGFVLRGHGGPVYALAFSPDGARLATGTRDGTVRMWDTASGEIAIGIRAHHDYVHALEFSPDGATLYSGSGDGTVRSWSRRPFAERWKERAAVLAQRDRIRMTVAELLDQHPTRAAAAEYLLRSDLDPQSRQVALDLVLELGSSGKSK